MTEQFKYDVFISHSEKDKLVVIELAKRLRESGLRVWLDDWEIKPGDSIVHKIEQGLEQSRILVLARSANISTSEWVKFESDVARFRDLSSRQRRFIPVQMDNAEIKDSQKHLAHIKWDTSSRVSLNTVIETLLNIICELKVDGWKLESAELMKKPGRSERRVVHLILDEFLKLLTISPFRSEIFRDAMLELVDNLVEEKGHYELLSHLQAAINDWFQSQGSIEKIRQGIYQHRAILNEALEILALQGSKVIESEDTILLYAYSESVHSAIEKWLQSHGTGILELVFCQCLWKRNKPEDPFAEPNLWANKIKHPMVRITFTTDAGVGDLLRRGQIKKVFFGAYQWDWRSTRRAWFSNTPGSLAIASVANMFDVPIFVIAETKKFQSDAPDTSKEIVKPSPERQISHPKKTKSGLTITFQDPGADVIDSKHIPFTLITEKGEFSCADFDLRKRNRVLVHADQLSVIKKTIDSKSALSEKTALQVLHLYGAKCTPKFQTPEPSPGKTNWACVQMQRKVGVRVHDFVATVNEIIRDSMNDEQRCQAEEFKKKIFEWALCDVGTWQSKTVQKPLHKAFDKGISTYDFVTKFEEAIKYVCPPSKAVLGEMEQIGKRLSDRATVFLRDATLKNQILEFTGPLTPSYHLKDEIYDYYPTADTQWFDRDLAIFVLNQIPQKISWDQLRDHIWHVDFELASQLTTREDDYIHILILELFSHRYDQIIETLVEQLPLEKTEHFHETILFRCFRGWARRLAYSRECHNAFTTRYRHESRSHYYNLMQEASQNLRSAYPHLARLIDQLEPMGNL